MDWKSLNGDFLRFDKKELVARWRNMSEYLHVANDMQVQYDDGPHNVTVYKISKGSLFYHGSTVKIANFDRVAFFSPHKEISRMILSLTGKKFHETKKAYLYTFRAKRDLYIVYNRNMGLGDDYSPFVKTQTIAQFCTRYPWLDGFFDFRDAAPMFPIFRLNKFKSAAEIQKEIVSLTNDQYFFTTYLAPGSDKRNEPVYTAEFIFCRPNQALDLIDTKVLSYNAMLNEWRARSLEWLSAMGKMSVSQRNAWIVTQKYAYTIGPIIPTIDRIYGRQYFLFRNKICRFEDIPSLLTTLDKLDLMGPDSQRLPAHVVAGFWIAVAAAVQDEKKIIKIMFPPLFQVHEKAALQVMLWLCENSPDPKKLQKALRPYL